MSGQGKENRNFGLGVVKKKFILHPPSQACVPAPLVNVQIFVSSRRGNQLDLHFEVLSKQDSTGPASVLRLITDDDMSGAAEKRVRSSCGIVCSDGRLRVRRAC